MIRLSGEQADALENEGKRIFLPVSWPPAQIREGDWVALGGYPGTMREQKAWNELDFTTYSIGATPVTSVSETNIGCRFERQRWVYGHRIDGVADPEDLGGLSGGPAFIVRQLHWELAGIMYEFSPTFDIMFLRPAHTIQEDGSIRPLP